MSAAVQSPRRGPVRWTNTRRKRKAALLERAKQFTGGSKKGSCDAEPKSLDSRLAEVISSQASKKNTTTTAHRRSGSGVKDKNLKKAGRGRVIVIRG